MDMVWIQTSRFNQFLHFGHGYFPASSGERVKVTGGFAINQIAVRIAPPRFDYREIGCEACLEQVRFAIKLLDLFASGNERPNAGFV
jgi:hypothetical protein